MIDRDVQISGNGDEFRNVSESRVIASEERKLMNQWIAAKLTDRQSGDGVPVVL